MIRLTEALITAIAPRPRSGRNLSARQKAWDGYVQALISDEAHILYERYGLVTPERMAMALANWSHETGGFTIIWESGAYSASRIMAIFGVGRHSAGVTAAEARRLAYKGPALFDRVYGVGNPRKARELGNDKPGDGWTYRGVGIVQITGKRDHIKYATLIGCPVEDLQKPLPSIHAALLEWQEKGCEQWADKGDVVKVRKLINGGRNGLADVRQYYAQITKLMGNAADPVLAMGDRGPEVAWLQERLKEKGFQLGPVDGIFGKLTERALAAWQLQHGFEATGRLDPRNEEMKTALNEAIETPEVVVREVDTKDLKESGSKTVETTSLWKNISGAIFGTSAFAAVDDKSGLGMVDGVVSQGEQVRSLVDRVTGLASWMPDTKILVILTVCVVAFVGYRVFSKIEARRLADARSGANLGH